MKTLIRNWGELLLCLPLKKRSGIIFALALLIRLCALYLLVKMRGVLIKADAGDYIQFAEYIIEQGFWVLDIEGLNAHSGPGYPLLLAVNFWISGGGTFWAALVLNTLFSALAVLMVYRIARILIPERWAFLPTMWYLIYIPQLWQVQFLGKESLVFGLFTTSIYCLLEMYRSTEWKYKYWIGFITSYTYLIHSDERYFFYFPFILLFFLTIPINLMGSLKRIGLIGAPIIILMIPWTIRNTIVYERPIILTERVARITDKIFGYTTPPNKHREEKISLSTDDGKKKYEAAADSIKRGFVVHDPRYEKKIIRSLEKGIEDGCFPIANSKWEERISYAFEFWRPFRIKSAFYGHGFRYMEKWSFDRIVFSFLQYFFLLPFVLVGLFLSMQKRNNVVLGLYGIVVIHFFIHTMLAHAIIRYRYPIDPILIIVAFWSIYVLYSQRIENKKVK